MSSQEFGRATGEASGAQHSTQVMISFARFIADASLFDGQESLRSCRKKVTMDHASGNPIDIICFGIALLLLVCELPECKSLCYRHG